MSIHYFDGLSRCAYELSDLFVVSPISTVHSHYFVIAMSLFRKSEIC